MNAFAKVNVTPSVKTNHSHLLPTTLVAIGSQNARKIAFKCLPQQTLELINQKQTRARLIASTLSPSLIQSDINLPQVLAKMSKEGCGAESPASQEGKVLMFPISPLFPNQNQECLMVGGGRAKVKSLVNVVSL